MSDPAPDGIDMSKLYNAAQKGQSYLWAMGLAMLITSIATVTGHPLDKQEGILRAIASMPLVMGILTAIQLFKWSSQAHQITCQLRGYSPRIPSINVGMICAFSFLLFFIPLSHTLDFLIVRSKNRDSETMNWKSLLSSSKLVNLFNLSIFLSFAIGAIALFPIISNSVAAFVGLFSTLALVAAMVFGTKIVEEVNKNLDELFKPFKEQTIQV